MSAAWFLALAQTPTPLLTEDAVGVARLFFSVVVPNVLVILGWLYWQSKKGGDAKADKNAEDLQALGRKVDEISRQAIADRTEVGALRERASRHEDAIRYNADRLAAGLQVQEDIRDMIREQGRETAAAIHKVELEVTKLAQAANIGEAVINASDKLADRLERALVKSRSGNGER